MIDDKTRTALELRLDRSRWWLLQEHPFYGQLVMGLKDTITDNPQIQTAATDGKRIFWNPTFCSPLTDEELRFVLLHETMHCSQGHMWRFPTNTPRANAACDHAINLTLLPVPGIKMPKVGLADPQYQGMAEEEIYALLPESPKQDGCGGYIPGEPGDDDGNGEGKGKGGDSLKDVWERRVIQAAQAAKALGQGNIPADMQRVLDKIGRYRIDWKGETADFVKTMIATRNDWSRPARRHAHQPVVYPRRQVDAIGVILFARDLSGSIDDATAAEFSALISQCIADTGCHAIVIDFDTILQAEYRLAPGEECPLTGKGGGGTDITVGHKRALELIEEGEHIGGIVTLTDLCGPTPESTDLPTLWLCTTDLVCSVGRTVRIEG